MLAELSVDARTAMWAKILGAPEDFGCAAIFVGEADGCTVGFGACGENRRDKALSDIGYSGEIGAIYVLRSHQGRGVGRSMMAAMLHALSVAGHNAAYLWVLRQNDPARAFYEKLGGVIVGEKVDELSDLTLVEDAYGWRNLSTLGS
jgi:GNAT superfamily N-acetyltransferase